MSEFKTFNGTDYHNHGGLWVPEDLQVGDIVKCRMMTKHSDTNETRMSYRNVMVLGMQMDPDTLEYTALHVARFSYTNVYCRDDENFLIPSYMERRGLVTGLAQQAVLKIDRTDFVPLTQDHFHGDVYDVIRLGKVSPELFKDIRDSLKAGHQIPNRHHSRFPERDTQQWYLPGMHVAGENILSPHHEHEFTQLSEIDLARIQADWALRKDPRKLDGAYVTKCMANIDRAQRDLARQMNWEARNKPKPHVHPLREKHGFANAAKHHNSGQAGQEQDETLSPDSQFLKLLPRAGQGDLEGLRKLAVHFKKQVAAPDFKLALPAHLWQGRYVLVKVPDLHDEQDDRAAHRPCAVWKAYADRNTGELVGLELHPVTRGSFNTFRYRFQVYPLKTETDRSAYLIADCIVRVPLTERYFHEKTAGTFFELPPEKLEKFNDRREHALKSGDKIHVYGLQEVPDDWVEIALDPTPSHQQFIKWSKNNQIRFDGPITERQRHQQSHHKGKRHQPD